MKLPAAVVGAALAVAGTAGIVWGAWYAGPNPPLAYGLVHVLAYAATLSLASGTAFMVAGAVMFGPVWGFVFNLAGMAVASTAMGLATRHGSPERVRGLPGVRHLAAVDPGVKAALRWRLSMLPHHPLNFAVGLGSMPMGTFFWVNVVGFAPSALIWSVAGVALRGWAEDRPGAAFAAAAGVFVAGLAFNFRTPIAAFIRSRALRRETAG